jgi:hypothetical protein
MRWYNGDGDEEKRTQIPKTKSDAPIIFVIT